MASVTLTSLWLNLASDLSQFRSFPLMAGLRIATEQPGEVRQYASGRRRLVRKAPTAARAVTLVLPQCDRDQIAWLEGNAGQLVLARDDRGRKVWGTYFTVSVDEAQGDPTAGDVVIALAEVTHSEVV